MNSSQAFTTNNIFSHADRLLVTALAIALLTSALIGCAGQSSVDMEKYEPVTSPVGQTLPLKVALFPAVDEASYEYDADSGSILFAMLPLTPPMEFKGYPTAIHGRIAEFTTRMVEAELRQAGLFGQIDLAPHFIENYDLILQPWITEVVLYTAPVDDFYLGAPGSFLFGAIAGNSRYTINYAMRIEVLTPDGEKLMELPFSAQGVAWDNAEGLLGGGTAAAGVGEYLALNESFKALAPRMTRELSATAAERRLKRLTNAERAEKSFPVLRLLREIGSEPRQDASSGKAPLGHAEVREEIVALLELQDAYNRYTRKQFEQETRETALEHELARQKRVKRELALKLKGQEAATGGGTIGGALKAVSAVQKSLAMQDSGEGAHEARQELARLNEDASRDEQIEAMDHTPHGYRERARAQIRARLDPRVWRMIREGSRVAANTPADPIMLLAHGMEADSITESMDELEKERSQRLKDRRLVRTPEDRDTEALSKLQARYGNLFQMVEAHSSQEQKAYWERRSKAQWFEQLSQSARNGDAEALAQIKEDFPDAVSISIDPIEVRVSDYRECVLAGDCTVPSKHGYCNAWIKDRMDHPINCVDFEQARAYCRWRGARLPTAAEWRESAVINEPAERPEIGTWPACSAEKGANKGCDFAGNLWEWVFVEELADTDQRALLGGSWDTAPGAKHEDLRTFDKTSAARDIYGFRCAEDGKVAELESLR